MHVHSTNTVWETVWEICNVAFADFRKKTTRKILSFNKLLKVCVTVYTTKILIFTSLPREVAWQPGFLLFGKKITGRLIKGFPRIRGAKREDYILVMLTTKGIFDHWAPVCYLTIYRESALRSIFEGSFIIAWQRSALSGCFPIHLCQGPSVTAGVYPLFFWFSLSDSNEIFRKCW